MLAHLLHDTPTAGRHGERDDAMTLDDAKHAADGLSVGALIGTLAGWLPSVASLFTILWLGIRIWESDTVQKIVARLRQ
jgi:hypothetical protein